MKNARSNLPRAVQFLASCSLLLLAVPTFAASTWSSMGTTQGVAGSGIGCTTSGGSSFGSTYAGVMLGNVANCGAGAGGSVTMAADAFSTTAGVNTAGTTFAKAEVHKWSSGLGIVNKYEDPNATGPHAVDNQYGTDAIRLTFSQQMTLSQVALGWNGTDDFGADSDISILAWVGPGTPGAIDGMTIAVPASAASAGSVATAQANSTLLTSGWQLISNVANVGALTTPINTAVISTTVYSSYWLISAYNTTFGGNMTNTNDYFKLSGIVASVKDTPPPGKVPEPGSLALMGAALAGVLAVRRRKGQAA